MVSSFTGTSGGFSYIFASDGQFSEASNGTGVCNEARSSRPSCMAHLRKSFTSQGISAEASELLLSSWRSKTQSNYNSLFTRWANWCEQRDRDPTPGPVEDVLNFLVG